VPDQDPFLEASVAPTLRGGDLVILWRLTPPRRGGLVVCPDPNAPGRAVVGRMVGDPGDSVVVKGSDVSVNEHRAYTERPWLVSDFVVKDPSVGVSVKQACNVEVLNGHSHLRGSASGYGMAPPDAKKDVEDGRAFLLSDNRLFPYDSR